MIGTAKKTDYPDTGVRLHAGTRRLPHQHRGILDTGSLADTARHRTGYYRHYYHLPHLEAPA
mgnify:CR=1 FL=1